MKDHHILVTYNNITELTQGDNRIVKTNFGLVIQGYLVPDSLNKKLASQNTLKSFSRSKIIFNTEMVSTTPDAPKTREEIRGKSGISIQPINAGIGYQIIGNSNEIG